MANLDYLGSPASVIDEDEFDQQTAPPEDVQRYMDAIRRRNGLYARQPQPESQPDTRPRNPLELPPVDDPRSYVDPAGVGDSGYMDVPPDGSEYDSVPAGTPTLVPSSDGGPVPQSAEDQEVMSHLPEEDTQQTGRAARAAGIPLPTDAPAPAAAPTAARAKRAPGRPDSKTLRELLEDPPVLPNPKWYQTLGAAALGGAAGWSNAASRTRHPIDIEKAAEGIKYPGYRGRLQEWRDKVSNASKLAEIDAQQAAVERQDRQDRSVEDWRKARAEYERAAAEKASRGPDLVDVTKAMEDATGGVFKAGQRIPAATATEIARIAAGKYEKPEKQMVVSDPDLAKRLGVKPNTPVDISLVKAAVAANNRAELSEFDLRHRAASGDIVAQKAVKAMDDERARTARASKPGKTQQELDYLDAKQKAADAKAEAAKSAAYFKALKAKKDDESKYSEQRTSAIQRIVGSQIPPASKTQQIREENAKTASVLQQTQNLFEEQIKASGGTAQHVEVVVSYPADKKADGITLVYPHGKIDWIPVDPQDPGRVRPAPKLQDPGGIRR